jgi:hypothetical protein
MGREAIEALMDRWVSDAGFREQVRTDPAGAVEATGIVLDADELDALRSIDWSLSDQELQVRVSKASSSSNSGC